MSVTQVASGSRPVAIVTGASSGIGFELARECVLRGYDLILAADRPLRHARAVFSALGARVEYVEVDLSTSEGVDALYELARHRTVDALLANAGHGLGRGFLEQDFEAVRHVLDTNITGTIDLVQRVGRDMVRQGHGRILITGSVAGFMPGTYQAVYNGTKSFIDSFAWALRNELQGTGVSVTCLMPGVTDTEFFERANLLDTKLGVTQDKMDPKEVARIGVRAMMEGGSHVVAGLRNRIQVAVASITPAGVLAEQHRRLAEPGSALRMAAD